VELASTPRLLVQKKTLRDSLPIDTLLSVVSVLVVAQSSSEVPEGLMNNPVVYRIFATLNVRIFHENLPSVTCASHSGLNECIVALSIFREDLGGRRNSIQKIST